MSFIRTFNFIKDQLENMLTEITRLRQSNRNLLKRWFSSQDMDLFVWVKSVGIDDMPVQFQLSYNKQSSEKVICWNLQNGCHLYQVDTGENCPAHYKETPIFTNTIKRQDLTNIARCFLAASENIDIGIADFIYARLMEYPALSSMLHAMHTNHPVHKSKPAPNKD